MDYLSYLDALLKLVLIGCIPLSIVIINRLTKESEAARKLREELKTYKDLLEAKERELTSLRESYERRIKELHERIEVLESLDNALREGKVKLVEVGSNEECRILVDGTIICGDHVLK